MNFSRILFAFLLSFGLVFDAGARSAEESAKNTLHVDASAEPGGDGSQAKPLRTLSEARDAVRAGRKDKSLDTSTPITVLVAPGVYVLDETLEFDARDGGARKEAPVIYRSTEPLGAKCVGGTMLPVSSFEKVSDTTMLDRLPAVSRDHVLVCDLKAQGIDAIEPMKTAFQGQPSAPWLYFDRRPMTLARWPNAGLPDDDSWAKLTEVLDTGLPQADGDEAKQQRRGGVFVYEDERLGRWNFDEGVWLHGYWGNDWSDEVIRIASYDPKEKAVTLAAPHQYGVSLDTWGKAYRRFYALNLPEELDVPGEWWIDRENAKLYFYPPKPLDGETPVALATLSTTLLHCKSAKNMRFLGFSFEYGHGNALSFANVENIEIAGCEIANFGGNGLALYGRENTVLSCDLYHLGRGGISLSGGDRKQLIPANNRVENCHIHHYGLFQRTYAAAVGVQGCGQVVRNNRIHDAPHNAILYGGNEQLLERNEIFRVVMETGDAGAFYTGRDWTTQGNVIRHNVIYDLGGGDAKHVNTMGVYLDDCDCGDTIDGNIFLAAGRAMMIGGGRDNNVVNNLFIRCPIGVHIDSRGMTWKQWNVPGGGWHLEGKAEELDYKGPVWSGKYPRLAKIMQDEPQAPLHNTIRRNVFIDCRKFESFDGDVQKLLDRLDIADNLLVDTGAIEKIEKAGDYKGFTDMSGAPLTLPGVGVPDRLARIYELTAPYREACPGFQDIPVGEIGLYKDEYRRKLPVAGESDAYRFDANGISRPVLENYLSRSITLTGLLETESLANDGAFPGKEDDLRLVRHIGAKLIGRAIYRWGKESTLNDPAFFTEAKRIAARVHDADPDVVLQAALFEIVTERVGEIRIPAWAFEALGLPVEDRNFRYENMIDPGGRFVDHWRKGSSVPDISRPETQLWFLFLAGRYMEVGCEAFHLGQVNLIGMNDRDWKHWEAFIGQLRRFAKDKSRRGWILLDAHTPWGGMVVDDGEAGGKKSLLDFNSFPLRIKEIPEKPLEGTLEVGYLDALFGRSMGCLTPSGWHCDALPYLVEFDNFGISRTPGEATPAAHFIWGYDEITWFHLQSEEYRNAWLKYAHRWVREHDPNGFLQMPVGRVIITGRGERGRFRANTRSADMPEGANLEETIKELFDKQ